MDRESIFTQMKAFPKVDLHRHLEGSITPETLLSIAQTYGGDLPAYDLESLKPHIQIIYDTPDFYNFLDKFKVFRGFYPCAEAIVDVAYTAVKEAAEDSVKYLELRYSPSHFAGNGTFKERDVIEWIQEGITKSSKEYGIVVLPVVTISRDYGLPLAEATVDLVTSLDPPVFYGLDIAGNEVEHPARPFKKLFRKAQDYGIRLTIHAGEVCGPANVREAVCDFHADRIGHGITSVQDDNVMEMLKKKDIMLEVCLTSNLHTGVVTSLRQHPVVELMRAGVPVSLNTDDPAISAITLTDEYVKAREELGLTVEDLKALNISALAHSFHPDRNALMKELSFNWK